MGLGRNNLASEAKPGKTRPWPWTAAGVIFASAIAFALMRHFQGWGWTELSVIGTVAAALVGAIAVIVSTRTLRLSAETARLTEETVKEMAAAREAQTRPIVVAYFERRERDLYLCVANAGNGPAASVRVTFDPPLLNSDKEDIGESPLLGEVIPLILPGSDRPMATFFDDADRYMGVMFHWGTGKARSSFTATINYTDPLTKTRYSTTSVVDLAHLARRRRLFPYESPEELKAKADEWVGAERSATLLTHGVRSEEGNFTVHDLLDAIKQRSWTASTKPAAIGGFTAVLEGRLADGEEYELTEEGATEPDALAQVLFRALLEDNHLREVEAVERRLDEEEAIAEAVAREAEPAAGADA